MSQQEMENLEEQADVETPDSPSQENGPEAEAPAPEEKSPEEALQEQLREQEDKYLRLLAEYDNYRKRSQKEKDAAWTNAKADTVKEILPVYDNLDRALKQECADEAYAKGVQMTMTQLKTVLEKLGITEIEALGQPFDPKVHNAVMHVEDEGLGENVVAEVFQAGFQLGDKVIRCSMVKVAN